MLSVVFLRTGSQEQDSSVHPSLGVVRHTSCGGLWTVSAFSFIMAGWLLFVILMYSSIKIQTHALLPPELTVNPAVITETDSVTLNCQTPSSVSVSQCYFYTLSGGTVRRFPCLQTLTGTELLNMSHQSSPAEVKVKCFYLYERRSPESDISSITIQTLLPPKLTVNPAVITETDSVTLNCQTPSSVSVPQCYFYTLRGGTVRSFPCLQTLTGSELLKMSNQRTAAQVKVKCFYLYERRSPESNIFSVTIQNSFPAMTAQALLPPELTVNPAVITETDSVTLNCQTPSSVSVSQCYFYTLSGGTVRSSSCLQTLTGSELLKMSHQSSPAEVKVKCFYTVKFGEVDLESPHCDTSSITIHNSVEREPSMVPAFSMTTGVTVYRSSTSTPVKLTSGSSLSTPSTKDGETPLKTAPQMWIWKFAAVVVGCGVTVAVVLLVSVIVCRKRRDVTGSQEVNNREPQNENYDTYHLYSTVSEEPAELALKSMMYSTVQGH